MVFPITDAKSGATVASIQKMYASSNNCLAALGRMGYDFDTFAVSFPEGSSQAERALLITGIILNEFIFSERDQTDGNDAGGVMSD